jgi:hypothetical protein
MLRFDEATEATLREIERMLCSRWRLHDKPSISLLVAGVVREYAASIKEDPSALKGLKDEIRARGGAVGKRGSFKEDASSPEKLEQLADAVAKGEAISDAEDILKEGAL